MSTNTKSERDAAKGKRYDVIRDLEVGMLTTVQSDGTLHTRPIYHLV